MNKSISMQKQQGMATLIFSLVVLFTLTITTIFGSRVSLLDEKMSNNDFRAKESLMAAEAGMNKVIADMQASATGDPPSGSYPYTWTGTVSLVNGIYESYTATATQESSDPTTLSLVKVVSKGCVGLTDCSGSNLESTITIQQYIASVPLLGESPAAPLVLTGGLKPTGTWDIVGKSGHGSTECKGVGNLTGEDDTDCGAGDLVSVWSQLPVEKPAAGSSATCSWADYIGSQKDAAGNDEYDDVWGAASSVPLCATDRNGGSKATCTCQNGKSGNSSHVFGPFIERTGLVTWPSTYQDIDASWRMSTDIVAPPVVDVVDANGPENFPSDLFAYVFGVAKTSYSTIKNAAQSKGRLLADCSSIDANSSGLYWITGDCNLGDDVGTPARPVLIIVEDHQIDMAAQTEGYGFLFGLDTTNAGNPSLQGNNGLWYGGIIVDYPAAKTNGNGSIVFRDGIFTNLQKITAINYAVVPGTWKDF